MKRPIVIAVFIAAACGDDSTGPGRQPITSVTVSPAVATIERGDTLQLETTVTQRLGDVVTDRVIEWSSSDTTTASVDDQGRVFALRGGITGVSATVEGVSGTASITVLGRVATVTVRPDSVDLIQGNTIQLTLTVLDRAGNDLSSRPVTWESSDETVASVSATGLVTAEDEGTAVVRVAVEEVTDSTVFEIALPILLSSVASGGSHTCGDAADDVVYCWGSDSDGQLGHDASDTSVPGALVRALNGVTAGEAHTCATDPSVGAWCWGRNDRGQLGNGTQTERDLPSIVSGSLDLALVSAGVAHTCGVTTTDEAHCWGANESGQLGDGLRVDQSEPAAVTGGFAFAMVSAGGSHSCGVTTTGTALCWGLNGQGQLGDGTNADTAAPSPVMGGLEFAVVSAGNAHSCGVTTGGVAYCWGANDSGQLGIGNNDDQNEPIAVTGNLTFSSISAGESHTCGTVTGDTAYCWGLNATGQLGAGTTGDSNVPMALSGALTFTSVTAGGSHSCGLSDEPFAYCWGQGASGQLGILELEFPPGFVNTPMIVAGQR